MDGKDPWVIVEREPSGSGKESADATVRNLAGFRVKADTPVGSKFVRADPYAAQVNAGNVKLRRGSWNQDYLNELRTFSEIAVYKDQVDASSGAFAFLSGRKLKIGIF
jgi:predicted phage terminase large subunit-like protein